MTVLHMMVGLPCAGKTTWAREIVAATGAIRLTPDDWQTQLYGNDMHHPYHGQFHDAVEAIMRDLAGELLERGLDVILDFGFWAEAERAEFRTFAKRLGVDCVMHYASASPAVLERRREERIKEGPADGFSFTAPELAEWIGLFELPDAMELAGHEVREAE